MKKKSIHSILKLFSHLVVIALLSSCATILGGRKHKLVFSEDSLPKAEVLIDGEWIGEAPGSVIVPKEKIQNGSVLVLKADGYESKEYVLLRKQSAVYSIVDLLIGGVPLIVDYSTGNIYRPNPRTFTYELTKKN